MITGRTGTSNKGNGQAFEKIDKQEIVDLFENSEKTKESDKDEVTNLMKNSMLDAEIKEKKKKKSVAYLFNSKPIT